MCGGIHGIIAYRYWYLILHRAIFQIYAYMKIEINRFQRGKKRYLENGFETSRGRNFISFGRSYISLYRTKPDESNEYILQIHLIIIQNTL